MKHSTMLLIVPLVLGGCCSVAPKPLAPDDVFAPYVSQTPKVAAVVGRNVIDGVEVTRLRFAGVEGSFEGKVKPCEYYAILARPAGPATAKRPAIMFCHGGAGFAREDSAVGWAKLGYVCIAPELVGYADNKKTLSVNRVNGYKYAEHIATVVPDRYACTLFDSVVSGLGAFNLLASQPDVDADRMGITGGSCGGYMATMLAGLFDTRLKAVFNLYGSGFVQYGSVFGAEVAALPAPQQKVWIDNFDAATRLARSRATYLTYAAANDHFFSEKSVIASFDAYAGPKRICWAPNFSHAIKLPGGTDNGAPLFCEMEPAYFACVLNGKTPPLPELLPTLGAAGGRDLKFAVANCPTDAEAWIYISPAADPAQKHEQRKWVKHPAVRVSRNEFGLCLSEGEPSDWFGGITFTLKARDVSRPMSLTTPMVRREPGKAEALLK